MRMALPVLLQYCGCHVFITGVLVTVTYLPQNVAQLRKNKLFVMRTSELDEDISATLLLNGVCEL